MKPSVPIRLRVGTTDRLVYQQVFENEQYNCIVGIHDYRHIIDAGANIGCTAVYFKDRHPDALVTCVEPDPSNFAMLLENTQANTIVESEYGCHRIASCVLGGLWDRECVGYLKDGGAGLWSMKTSDRDEPPLIHSTRVHLFPIDRLIRTDLRPRLVKMDIEGAEFQVFKDHRWMHHVDVLAVEIHNQEAANMMTEALEKCGRNVKVWSVGEITVAEFG